MTETRHLIDQLAARAEPVRPLSSPLRRTLAWSALAAVMIGMIVWVYGVRAGLAADLSRPPVLVDNILRGTLRHNLTPMHPRSWS